MQNLCELFYIYLYRKPYIKNAHFAQLRKNIKKWGENMSDEKANELIAAINELTAAFERIADDGLAVYSPKEIISNEIVPLHCRVWD